MTTPQTAKDDERHARPFAEWLLKQAHGKLAQELTDKLDQLVQAVHMTGKAGTLALQITLKPLEKGDGSILTVTDKVAVKLPVESRPPSLFFVDHDGNLSQNDPNQMTLELHEVPTAPAADKAKLKEAGNA